MLQVSPAEFAVDCGPELPILRLAGNIAGEVCDIDEVATGAWEVVCEEAEGRFEEANPVELIALHGERDGSTANLEYVRFSQSGAVEVVQLSDVAPGWRVNEVAVNPDGSRIVYQSIDQDPPVDFCCSDCPVDERELPRLHVALLDKATFTARMFDVPIALDADPIEVGRLWGFGGGLGAGRGNLEDIYAQTTSGFFTLQVGPEGVGAPVKRQGREIDPFDHENLNSTGAFTYLWDTSLGPYRLQYRPEGKPDGVWVSSDTIARTKVADCVDCGVHVFDSDNAMMVAERIYSVDVTELQPSRVSLIEMSRLPKFSSVELPRDDYVMVQPLAADGHFSTYYGVNPNTPYTCQ